MTIDSLLVRLLVVGGLVVHEGSGTATVEEVDGNRLVVAVGRLELAVEVREEVDLLAIDLTLCEDTGNLDANIGLGVCK